ncbi:TetR/AcrR family transcriptional regulator [Streptomyces sp. NBC_01283]|uniref:TetR family transcriptional regulator n=1 Tax=Streptomyces sp. NBC_01283 TaxID=2903812 RepID=UPI00352F319A|nr:TetR/AcrR family transcriptional regulator [Streptomyces sp. NBC_01283]
MRSAADLFAEQGFRRASVCSIAANAGCDPALVGHYFASKEALFTAVAAETVRPAEVLREAVGRRDPDAAEWLLRNAVADWDDGVQRTRILGVLRSALDLSAAESRLRQSLVPERVADDEGGEMRLALIGGLFVGVVMARHLELLPAELAKEGSSDELVRALMPVVAGCLEAGR